MLTISEFADTLRITFHVELRHNDISQLHSNILEVSPLHKDGYTMVAQIDSSRLSELAFTYACMLFIYN